MIDLLAIPNLEEFPAGYSSNMPDEELSSGEQLVK